MKSHVTLVLLFALVVTMVHSAVSTSGVNYRYCKDTTSLGKVSSVTLTNCSSGDSPCELKPSREAILFTAYYPPEKSYTAWRLSLRLLGGPTDIDLLEKEGMENMKAGIAFSITVNFDIPAETAPGNYVLELQRNTTCPGDPTSYSTAELCIEIDVLIPGGEGGECNPDDCKQVGYCRNFTQCVKDYPTAGLSSWKTLNCSQDLFWHPNSTVFGGTCDFFDNLPLEVQEKYRNDPDCILPCAWWQETECSPTYKYREPFDNKTLLNREHNLTCPSDPSDKLPLLWNPATYTCDHCSNVKNNSTKIPCPCPHALF